MRIAVISQGPSYHLFDPQRAYDAVIGVNGMPTLYQCDWWSFSDWNTFNKWADDVIGQPKIAIRGTSPSKFEQNKPEQFQRFQQWDWVSQDELGLPKIPTGGNSWNKWSGCGALGLAWYLLRESGDSEKVVECFGVDMTGNSDAHGRGGNRTPDRWQSEQHIWANMTSLMNQEGIEVVMARQVEPAGDDQAAEPQLVPSDYHARPTTPTKWRYMSRNGNPVSQRFLARGEREFRELLAGLIGRNRAETVEVFEVED